MASAPTGRVVLMSIHPEFADAIMRGDKTVEFRRRPIGSDVTHVIVYATAPVSAVVAAFSVAGQEVDTPGRLWRKFSRVAGISRRRFFDYYEERETGAGIRVGDVFIPDAPLKLAESLGVSRPPQSYQYIPPQVATHALARMAPQRVGMSRLPTEARGQSTDRTGHPAALRYVAMRTSCRGGNVGLSTAPTPG